MAIIIRVDGDDAETELRSLHQWLLNDPDVLRHSQISLMQHEPRPGEMGGALEAVQLILDNGFQAMNFALAYATWRVNRRQRPRVIIEYGGAKVTLPDADADTIKKIVELLESGDRP